MNLSDFVKKTLTDISTGAGDVIIPQNVINVEMDIAVNTKGDVVDLVGPNRETEPPAGHIRISTTIAPSRK